jgi:hypothetical protein
MPEVPGGHPYRTWHEPRSPTDVDMQCRYCTAARTQRCYRCGSPICAYHALPEWQRCGACEVEYLTYGLTGRSRRRRVRRLGLAAVLALMLLCMRYPMAFVGAIVALLGMSVRRTTTTAAKSRRARFMAQKLW